MPTDPTPDDPQGDVDDLESSEQLLAAVGQGSRILQKTVHDRLAQMLRAELLALLGQVGEALQQQRIAADLQLVVDRLGELAEGSLTGLAPGLGQTLLRTSACPP